MTHITHTHTHKTYAMGLLFSKSPALYLPQIVLVFSSKIHSNEARNQKTQHWVSAI